MRISETAHRFVEEQYQVWNEMMIPALSKDKIRLLRRTQWKPQTSRWIHRYFRNEVLPVLSPIGLDPAHPFPRVLNKNLYFIISLDGKDAFGRDSGLAIVQAPRSLPRIIQIPARYSGGSHDFILLSSIIHAHVSDLFPGMNVMGCYQFKVTRDSDLLIDDVETDDLLRALKGELPSRRFSDAVRLEVADNCPDDLSHFYCENLSCTKEDLYQVNGHVSLGRLLAICDLVDRPELKFPGFTPDIPRRLVKTPVFFDTLHNGDIVLHHPFQSFAPVMIFYVKQPQIPMYYRSNKRSIAQGPNQS
jgi:polyphosphate kinase